MAWTQQDLDALNRAIASGARRVRYPDGGEVEYRSLAEMQELRAQMAGALGPVQGLTTRATLARF